MATTTAVVDAPSSDSSPSFAELGVRPEIVTALGERGITHTFAIQELTLPLALAGSDLIGQARTGMGKTYGFGVPLLHRISTGEVTRELDGTPRALIIVPTRELCVQVTQDLKIAATGLTAPSGSGTRPLKVLAIYGGTPYEQQTDALEKGVDVVVGTPGRLLDLANQSKLVLGKVEVLVLDEADEMLDLGFLPDIEKLLRMVPDQRQTMLFSATMPGPIITLARTFLTKPTHIRAEAADSGATHENTTQYVYRAHSMDKPEVVSRILQADGRGATMVFCRTKRTAQKLADDLAERGFRVGAIHGDLGQGAREKSLKAFRSGDVDVLVATDVAARGIDVDDVTHVINYQCPEDEKTYVHRIGRTGRAGRKGVAVTLVDWDDLPRWGLIDKALGLGHGEPAETYSTSPHLRAELGIPEGAGGRVGAATGTGSGRRPADRDSRGSGRESGGGSGARRRTRTGGSSPQAQSPAAGATSATDAGSGGDAGGDPGSDSAPSGDGAPRRRRRRRRPSSTSDSSGRD
ncbi:DEAD/DEAH box helicase [Dietzia psychralcaliphila]|uniref:RNA helicase n=1 Tax=Dietzia psychralcaliphila TaxID=139021 RepID=A0AAD0JV09_9ACTN|nr:DEAD/DEAH box helicase [Dietzia psychralcaliphila]AWH97217.1 DEAD/DEAH box helicase [Dietzia psychralcaliphila]PTM86766.1 superfamily II DNA/RNA helicase [Dietzia psychralcaliphila]